MTTTVPDTPTVPVPPRPCVTEKVVQPPAPVPAVRLTNAACPRCDGPVDFHPATWLTCGGSCRGGKAVPRA